MQLNLNPKAADVYMNLANAYKSNNELPIAIDVLSTGIAKNPDNNDIRHLKALFLYADMQYDMALDELEWILDKDEFDLNANYDIAKIYFDMGLYDNAISHYIKILDSMDNSADIHYNIAMAYAAGNNIDKAIFHLFNVISINEAYYPAYKKLGVMLLAKGEREEAKEYLEKYIKFDLPEDEINEIKKILEPKENK